MTNFDRLKAMSLEEFANFIDDNAMYDGTPWMEWWDNTYCDKCESVILNFDDTKELLNLDPLFEDRETECAYCEVYDKCKYFKEFETLPTLKDIIKLWLEATDDT